MAAAKVEEPKKEDEDEEDVKDSWDASSAEEEEDKEEEVKDSWDASSSDEEEEEKKVEEKKPAPKRESREPPLALDRGAEVSLRA